MHLSGVNTRLITAEKKSPSRKDHKSFEQRLRVARELKLDIDKESLLENGSFEHENSS